MFCLLFNISISKLSDYYLIQFLQLDDVALHAQYFAWHFDILQRFDSVLHHRISSPLFSLFAASPSAPKRVGILLEVGEPSSLLRLTIFLGMVLGDVKTYATHTSSATSSSASTVKSNTCMLRFLSPRGRFPFHGLCCILSRLLEFFIFSQNHLASTNLSTCCGHHDTVLIRTVMLPV